MWRRLPLPQSLSPPPPLPLLQSLSHYNQQYKTISLILENENISEPVVKKKRSDDPIKNVANENAQKRLLTERQQLAFLLEATSTRESADDDNDSTFTKITSCKKTKRNGKSGVNPRVSRRNERGETALHLTAIKGDVVSLKKLIKDGADIGLKDYAGRLRNEIIA